MRIISVVTLACALLSPFTALGDPIVFKNICDIPEPGYPCFWLDFDLSTGPIGPKKYYGDTNTAYAGFLASRDYLYKIQGKFSSVRFLSLETSKILENDDNIVRRLEDFDNIWDYEIEPDDGSNNPFTENGVYIPGIGITGPFNYTVYLAPDGYIPDESWKWKNVLYMSKDVPYHLISLRIVAPNAAVSIRPLDLPIITRSDYIGAAQAESQPPTPPESLESFQYSVEDPFQSLEGANLIQFIVGANLSPELVEQIYPEQRWKFDFQVTSIVYEGNSAVPNYAIGLSKMRKDMVAMVRFKAPSATNTYPATEGFYEARDVRFFSLCSVDVHHGLGLACLPDHLSRIDKDGYVTLVYGPPGRIEKYAAKRGYNFLPDTRVNELLVLAYRQILPSVDFSNTRLHKGPYLPSAIICSQSEVLLGICNARLRGR